MAGDRTSRSRRRRKLVPDEIVQMLTASGTPAEARERVQDYLDNGCTCPILYPLGDVEGDDRRLRRLVAGSGLSRSESGPGGWDTVRSVKLRPLGRTGVRVPPICLGTMTFGVQCDEDTSFAILDRALEGGVDFIDTADVYPLGGDHTHGGPHRGDHRQVDGQPRRARPASSWRPSARGGWGPVPTTAGSARYHVSAPSRPACAGSAPTSSTSTRRTPSTPTRRSRRRCAPSTTSCAPARCATSAARTTRRGGWPRRSARATASASPATRRCSPATTSSTASIETEVLPLCAAERIGVIVYNPIAGGLAQRQAPPRRRARGGHAVHARQRRRPVPPAVLARATCSTSWTTSRPRRPSAGVALASVAVAWSLRQPGVTSAIVGASRPEQLDATLAGADLELDDDLVALCDSAWWQLPRQPVQEGYR